MSHGRRRQMKLLRPLVWDRAAGRCEANGTYARCPSPAQELQHALPRSQASVRDQHLLDRAAVAALDDGTFVAEKHLAHLLALCKRHHDLAHANSEWGRSVGLVIAGQVRTWPDGTPVYIGPSVRMARLWPPPDAEGEAIGGAA